MYKAPLALGHASTYYQGLAEECGMSVTLPNVIHATNTPYVIISQRQPLDLQNTGSCFFYVSMFTVRDMGAF